MKTDYRKLFLKDLKKLKKHPVYQQIHTLAFTTLPNAAPLQEVPNVKAMVGTSNRYRIRIGNDRVGVEVNDKTVTLMRVLHRGEFYRYFP